VLNPDRIIRKLAKRYPNVVYSVDTHQPAVALTLDDGPHPSTTGAILDVLRQHGAKATFFLITGRLAGNETVVRRIVDEGHEIANHLSADQPSISLSPLAFERALLASHDMLTRFAPVRWFRPGSGWYNGIMLAILYKHGYQCALGSVYPYDAWIPSSWFATRFVLARVRPGSVMVLHDHGARGRRTASTLAVVLPELARRGLKVVTLAELAGDG
jgi:peptidoglycan/xylan/chitin deacetylase (PgdA/CDA1 family)